MIFDQLAMYIKCVGIFIIYTYIQHRKNLVQTITLLLRSTCSFYSVVGGSKFSFIETGGQTNRLYGNISFLKNCILKTHLKKTWILYLYKNGIGN